MRSILLALLVSTAWISAHQPARPAEVPSGTMMATQSDIDSRVRSIVAMRFRAAQAKTISDIAPLYSDDKNLIVFRQGEVVRGWDAYGHYWESSLTSLPPMFQVRFQDVAIQTTSQMAFATALWTMTYQDKSGKQISKNGLITLVLVDKPGGWHIVHEHISSENEGGE